MGVIVASITQKNNSPTIFYYTLILYNLNSLNQMSRMSFIRIHILQKNTKTDLSSNDTKSKRLLQPLTLVFSPINLSNLVNYG